MPRNSTTALARVAEAGGGESVLCPGFVVIDVLLVDRDAARKVLLGGALTGDDGAARLGSCLIINVPGRDAAEAFSRDEPFRRAGLFRTVKITRMRRGQWNPAAAPATEEGN